MSPADARALARELYVANPKVSQGMIGTCLGRPQQRVSDWIRDLRDREMQKREWSIEVLGRLGWTQEEIGEALGLTRQGAAKAMQPLADSLKVAKTQIAKTRQVEEVATAYNMPRPLATALDLDSVEEDADRLKQLDVALRPHDAWMFSGFRDLFGHDYPGRIPGDLLSNGDAKIIAREICTDNPEYDQTQIAKLLGLTQPTISGYVSDILAKRREERRAKGLRLRMLGWTQQEIAERLGIHRDTVATDLSENIDADKILQSGHTPGEIALRLGWPVQLVLAKMLEKADDAARFEKLEITSQPYDVWRFPADLPYPLNPAAVLFFGHGRGLLPPGRLHLRDVQVGEGGGNGNIM